MNTIHRILIGVAVAALLPTAAFGQDITYDVGRADFHGLKTFAFKDSPADDRTTEATTAYDSPLVAERTQAAIAAQLAARGLRLDNDHPDMYVIAHRTFKTEYSVYANGWGPGYGWGWGWGWGPYYTGWGSVYGSTWYTDEDIIGTLIVDVQNAATGELMWRGLAEKRVHEHSSPENRTKRVNKEVAKLFEKFPGTGPVATSGRDLPTATDR
jgi:hypothetical protein